MTAPDEAVPGVTAPERPTAVRPRTAVASAAGLLVVLAVAAAVRVPWHPLPGARGRVDVLRDFTRAQVAREDAFHAAIRPAVYTSLLLGLVVAALLGLTPLGARLVRATGRPLGGSWPVQVVLGSVVVALVGRLVTLLPDARAEQVLRAYGLSSQGWAAWLLDAAKGTLVQAGLSSVALLALVGLARRVPRWWWAWGAGTVAALVLVGSFVYPLVVEPVFNAFTPLPAGPLRTTLLAEAARDGVPVRDVLVADASRRTTALNAYVSGFGPSRRIVVYDTLVARSTPQEVALVVAHELGHAKRDDVLTGTALGALGAAAGVCLLGALLSSRRLLRRAGVTGPGDPRVVALLSFLVLAGTWLTSPATTLVSRRIEARADVHALDLTRDPATFAAAQKQLALVNLSDLDPNPVVYGVFATHPTGPERLLLARAWQRLHG